jgi:hypothetical protein
MRHIRWVNKVRAIGMFFSVIGSDALCMDEPETVAGKNWFVYRMSLTIRLAKFEMACSRGDQQSCGGKDERSKVGTCAASGEKKPFARNARTARGELQHAAESWFKAAQPV